MPFTSLKTGLRAGALALVLGSTALVGAMPAQAAPPPASFGFSLNFGNGGPPKGGMQFDYNDDEYFDFCLTNSQIRSGLRSKGYRDVQIVREDDRNDKVWVVARKGGDWYQLRIDRCSGKVDRVREIERKRNGSFNLKFSF